MEDDTIQHKIKHKNRKARYTFPNELDDVYDKPSRHKHRRRTYTYSISKHNCDDIVRITEYNGNDGIYKKVVIQKYILPTNHPSTKRNCSNKTYPEIQEEDTADKNESSKSTKPVVGCLSAVIIKILCILGIISISL